MDATGARVVQEYKAWAEEGVGLVAEIRRAIVLEFVVVPAHGESKEWKPTIDISGSLCRALNAKADEAAKDKLDVAMRDTDRSKWQQRLEQRQDWQRRAIKYASEVHDAYLAYFASCK